MGRTAGGHEGTSQTHRTWLNRLWVTMARLFSRNITIDSLMFAAAANRFREYCSVSRYPLLHQVNDVHLARVSNSTAFQAVPL